MKLCARRKFIDKFKWIEKDLQSEKKQNRHTRKKAGEKIEEKRRVETTTTTTTKMYKSYSLLRPVAIFAGTIGIVSISSILNFVLYACVCVCDVYWIVLYVKKEIKNRRNVTHNAKILINVFVNSMNSAHCILYIYHTYIHTNEHVL